MHAPGQVWGAGASDQGDMKFGLTFVTDIQFGVR